jgi:putative PIN family toxin of toxin-antitoxin system
MRVLLDSNVLVRALYSVGGPAEEVVRRLALPPHVLVVSTFLLTELHRVLRYPRLQRLHGLDGQKIERAVAAVATVATHVEPRDADIVAIVPEDPDDDKIVAAAVAARADVICTRNKHFFHEAVIAYCRRHAIEVMDDVALLDRLRNQANG